ncbi:sulfatase [Planctomycetales bacterium ZRK34]|nr:sulfatase [Planctomycetales bacterium ZRK34]
MATAAPRPNIVFILVDDLGWSDPACYGHPWHRTPNIDRLARQGMRFTNGYSPAPICSAARASILTGKTTARLGFEFVTKPHAGSQQLDKPQPLEAPPYTLNLPLSERTITERLAALNYQTAFFGKWHVSQHHKRYLGWDPKYGPKAQGFEVAVEDFGDHPYAWGRKTPANAPQGMIPKDSMIERSAAFIREKHDRPFFLMVSTFYVHTPVKTRCRWLVDEYESRIAADAPNRKKQLEYAAFVEVLDHHVGTVLDAIDDAGLRDNTLVVFLSDNGGHPEYCANGPLRGSKWNLYEGGIREPMVARWPGRIQPGVACDTPVIGYDLLPTFVELAGGQAEDVDGVSIAPVFDDASWRPRRSLLWHFPYYHPETDFSKARRDIGVNDFATSQTRPQSAIRQGRYKLIYFAEDERVELYDLETDPAEQHDLSQAQPGLASEMNQQLQRELHQMHARRAARR